MPRIALVLSGAVSLGSFEAGVLDELLFGLERTGARGDTTFTVDVIAGASAGAISGALLARCLLVAGGRRGLLHAAWVDQLDVAALLAHAPPNALLSDRTIREMARRYLGPPSPEASPAPFAGPTIHLSLALSSLNGVDYRLGVRHPAEASFLTTVFRDRRRFALDRSSASGAGIWAELGDAAIASGSFPVALPPTTLASAGGDYGAHAFDVLPPEFTYVDGGLFDNEPIGEAVDLARAADGGSVGASDRIFLLVDANLDRSDHDPAFGPEVRLSQLLPRLSTMVRRQATARDWLRAGRINNELAWRDEVAAALAGLVRSAPPDALEAELAGVERATRAVERTKRSIFGEERYGDDYLPAALARTRERHIHLLTGIEEPGASTLLRLLFLLDSASGLERKTRLNLGLVHAEEGETAGDRLSGFGGFFEREWREHDYRLGRRRAASVLPDILDVDPWGPEPGTHYDHPLDPASVRMSDVDRGTRELLRARALERARAALSDWTAGRSAVVRWAIWRAARRDLHRRLGDALELN